MKKARTPPKSTCRRAEITVTMPGHGLSITYLEVPNAERLVPIESWITENSSSPAISLFKGRAFVAAVMKAKELGWLT